ncbi:GIY-YIG nuclease family protein [Patiriisocius sp. Uisw_017]|jgi:predicted GIY-YIG superfamily endonuclease
MANAYVYILVCNDNSYYVGSTKDVGMRFWGHSNG